jgi:hypothetical protein
MKLRILAPDREHEGGTRVWSGLATPQRVAKVEVVRFPSRLQQRPKRPAVIHPLLCPCEARRLRGITS